MALLKWSSKYSVGVQSMDIQHTVLFDILNDLHTAMMKGQAQSSIGALLRKLADYARNHFSAEEAIMASTRYPDLPQHRLKHLELNKQVAEFVTRFERGESALTLQLMNFLRDWLTNHIQNVDHGYSSWMNSHGVH